MKKILLILFVFVSVAGTAQTKYLINNGQIVKRGLPTVFKRATGALIYGGYETRNDLHFTDGWRDEIKPAYNATTQRLGARYYDSENDVVSYKVINITLPTLEAAKLAKIKEMREAVKDLYNDIQWLIQDYQINGEALPAALKTKVKTIRTKYNQFKTNVNSKTTVIEVLTVKIPYEQIETLQQQFDSYY